MVLWFLGKCNKGKKGLGIVRTGTFKLAKSNTNDSIKLEDWKGLKKPK